MKIEIWADVACPWCYVGERRLRRALEATGAAAELHWRPYQLQPGTPRPGIPWDEFVERKFGGWERARGMFAHVARAGAEEGIRFDFERVPVSPNTADAHRVILLAEREGLLWPAVEAIYAAYFTDGRNVGDPAVLAEIGGEIGLGHEHVEALLAGEEHQAAVQASQAEAAQLGVSGVPFIAFDRRFAVSGAQALDVFIGAIRQAAA